MVGKHMTNEDKKSVYIKLKENSLTKYINDPKKLTKKQLKTENYLKFFSTNVKEVVSLSLRYMFCFLCMFFLLAVFTYFFAPQESQNQSGWNGIIKSITAFLMFYVPYEICFSTINFYYKKAAIIVNDKIKKVVIESALEYLENNKEINNTFIINELFKYKTDNSSDFFKNIEVDVLEEVKKDSFLENKKVNHSLTLEEKLVLIKNK